MRIATVAAIALLSWAAAAQADTINLTVDDSEGRPTWSGEAWGDPPAAPTAGNDYVVPGGMSVRTPEGFAPAIDVFPGDSIRLQGSLMLKANPSGETHQAAYICDGGSFKHGSGGREAVLAGSIDVLTGTTNEVQINRGMFRFTARITGDGTLQFNANTDDVYALFTNSANSFTGLYDLADSGNDLYYVGFDYAEAAGASLAITGDQAKLRLDRTLSFKAVTLDDAPLADGTYTFDDPAISDYLWAGSDGTLVVDSALPEPTTMALLALGTIGMLRRRR